MPKINFIIHFFQEILHFKESCNLIGQQYFGPQLENHNFARYGIAGEISITISVFILDYYQEKLTTKLFKKPQKPYFGTVLDPFCPIWAKMNFPGKNGSVLDIPIIYHIAKNQKKLLEKTHS